MSTTFIYNIPLVKGVGADNSSIVDIRGLDVSK
jgi:hypothetical protein